MKLIHQSDDVIRQAIVEQLPRGYETAPCWFPLTVEGQEYYIMGRQLVTLEEYKRLLARKIEVLCAF